jgi:hypothetical protein
MSLFFPTFLYAFDLSEYKTIICQEKDGSQSALKFYRYQNDTYNIHFENSSNKLYEIYMMKVYKDRFFTISVSSEKTYVSLDRMMKFYVFNSHFYVEWKLRTGRTCKKQYLISSRGNGVMYCRHKESFFPKPPDPYRQVRR